MKGVLLALVVLVGCKDSFDEDWVVKDAKKSIAKLEASLGKPKVASSIVDCGQMANFDVLEKKDKAVAARLRQLCTIDIHVAIMKVQVEELEAKRKVKPADELGIDCMDPFYEHEKKMMIEAGTLDHAKAITARFEALCPPKP